MKKYIIMIAIMAMTLMAQARTLVVYYSYTNNVNRIVTELTKQIEADVVRIEPAEKGLDYAANNYAIGSAQIAAIRNNPNDAASYPDIDPVNVNLANYDCIIIGAPLWWSNMAAPLQTYLFQYGKDMAGKHIGLIVSSASSGISDVESDAKRLIPEGQFFSSSLWIRSSQTSNCASLISRWLKDIGYESISGFEDIRSGKNDLSVSTSGKTIIVSKIAPDDAVSVYNVEGRLIYRGKKHQIDVEDKGIYLVRVDNTTRKVRI